MEGCYAASITNVSKKGAVVNGLDEEAIWALQFFDVGKFTQKDFYWNAGDYM